MSQTYVDPVTGHHIVDLGKHQMSYDHATGRVWVRYKVGNDWLSWTEVIQEPKIQGKKTDFVVFDESGDIMKNEEPKRKQYLTDAEQRRNYFNRERELRGQTIEQQAQQEKRQEAYKDKNWGEFA